MKPIALLMTILLVGCVATNQDAQKSLANQKDLEHKVLCAKYLDSAKAALEKNDKDNSIPDSGIDQQTSIWNMFFSTTRNSCLYSWDKMIFSGESHHRDQTDEFGLTDALTGEDIHFEYSTGAGDERTKAEMKFEDYLKQFQ